MKNLIFPKWKLTSKKLWTFIFIVVFICTVYILGLGEPDFATLCDTLVRLFVIYIAGNETSKMIAKKKGEKNGTGIK